MPEADFQAIVNVTPDASSLTRMESIISSSVEKGMSQGSRKGLIQGVNANSITQPLGRITGKANEFEKSMQAANARVIAFGAATAPIFAVAAAFHKLVDSTIEVEKVMTNINAIFELSASSLRKFTMDLFETANKNGQSWQMASEAAAEFARQGLNAEETLKRTSAALILNRISGLNMAESVSSITSTINSFSKEALTAQGIIEKLTAVDTSYAVSAGDLAEALKRIGSSASDANVSLNKTLALITSAKQITGREGSVIGNSLKTIMTRLQRPEILDQLEEAGVTVKDLNGKLKPLDETLKNLASTYQGLAQSQKSFVAESVGGVYQINILKAEMKDLGSGLSIYDQVLNTINNSTGALEKRTGILNATLASGLVRTMNDLSLAASSVGEHLFGNTAKSGISFFDNIFKGTANGMNKDNTGLGAQTGQGIVKGVGNFLAGPGLQMGINLILKLLTELAAFAQSSGKDILGLDKGAKEREALENRIFQILSKESGEWDAIITKQKTSNQFAKEFLGMSMDQNKSADNKHRVAENIASQLTGKDLYSGNGISSAGGFVPNLDPMQSEMRMAAQGGYVAGNVISTQIQNGNHRLNTIANTRETKSMVFSEGKQYEFVNPPYGSMAGKSHERESVRKTGINPYSLAQMPLSGGGFVPNLANFIVSPDNIKNILMGNHQFSSLKYYSHNDEIEKQIIAAQHSTMIHNNPYQKAGKKPPMGYRSWMEYQLAERKFIVRGKMEDGKFGIRNLSWDNIRSYNVNGDSYQVKNAANGFVPITPESIGLIKQKGSLGKKGFYTTNDEKLAALSVIINDKAIHLNHIQAAEFGKGAGTEWLTKLKTLSDATRKPLTLVASALNPSSQKTLESFYTRNGLKPTDNFSSFQYDPKSAKGFVPNLVYGHWIGPAGHMIETDDHEGTAQTIIYKMRNAQQITQKEYEEIQAKMNRRGDYSEPYQTLHKHDYLRGVTEGNKYLVNGMKGQKLTYSQRSSLKDYGMENGISVSHILDKYDPIRGGEESIYEHSARGYIPLMQALKRENKATGGNAKISFDPRLESQDNPFGFAAIDSRTQKNASQAISQHLSLGQGMSEVKKAHTSNGFVPNLALSGGFDTSLLLTLFGSGMKNQNEAHLDKFISLFPVLFDVTQKEIMVKRKLVSEFDAMNKEILINGKSQSFHGQQFDSLKQLEASPLTKEIDKFREDITNNATKISKNVDQQHNFGFKLASAASIGGGMLSQMAGTYGTPTLGAATDNFTTSVTSAGQALIAFPDKIGKALAVGFGINGVLNFVDVFSKQAENMKTASDTQLTQIKNVSENLQSLAQSSNNLNNLYLDAGVSMETISRESKNFSDTLGALSQMKGGRALVDKILTSPDATSRQATIQNALIQKGKEADTIASLQNLRDLFLPKKFLGMNHIPGLQEDKGFSYNNYFDKDSTQQQLLENAKTPWVNMSKDFQDALVSSVGSIEEFTETLNKFQGSGADDIRGYLEEVKKSTSQVGLGQVVQQMRAIAVQERVIQQNPEIQGLIKSARAKTEESQLDVDSAVKHQQFVRRLLLNQGAMGAENIVNLKQFNARGVYQSGLSRIAGLEAQSGLFAQTHGERTVAQREYSLGLQRNALETNKSLSDVNIETNKSLISGLTQSFDSVLKQTDLQENITGEKNLGISENKALLVSAINNGLTSVLKGSSGDIIGRFSRNGQFDFQAFAKTAAMGSSNNPLIQQKIEKYLGSQESVDILKTLNNASYKQAEILQDSKNNAEKIGQQQVEALRKARFEDLAKFMGGIANLGDRKSMREMQRNETRGVLLMNGATPQARAMGAKMVLDSLTAQGIRSDSNKLFAKAHQVFLESGTATEQKEGGRMQDRFSNMFGSDSAEAIGIQQATNGKNAQEAVMDMFKKAYPPDEITKEDKESGAFINSAEYLKPFDDGLIVSTKSLVDFPNALNATVASLQQATENINKVRELNDKAIGEEHAKLEKKIQEIEKQYGGAANGVQLSQQSNSMSWLSGAASPIASALTFAVVNAIGNKGIASIGKIYSEYVGKLSNAGETAASSVVNETLNPEVIMSKTAPSSAKTGAGNGFTFRETKFSGPGSIDPLMPRTAPSSAKPGAGESYSYMRPTETPIYDSVVGKLGQTTEQINKLKQSLIESKAAMNNFGDAAFKTFSQKLKLGQKTGNSFVDSIFTGNYTGLGTSRKFLESEMKRLVPMDKLSGGVGLVKQHNELLNSLSGKQSEASVLSRYIKNSQISNFSQSRIKDAKFAEDYINSSEFENFNPVQAPLGERTLQVPLKDTRNIFEKTGKVWGRQYGHATTYGGTGFKNITPNSIQEAWKEIDPSPIAKNKSFWKSVVQKERGGTSNKGMFGVGGSEWKNLSKFRKGLGIGGHILGFLGAKDNMEDAMTNFGSGHYGDGLINTGEAIVNTAGKGTIQAALWGAHKIGDLGHAMGDTNTAISEEMGQQITKRGSEAKFRMDIKRGQLPGATQEDKDSAILANRWLMLRNGSSQVDSGWNIPVPFTNGIQLGHWKSSILHPLTNTWKPYQGAESNKDAYQKSFDEVVARRKSAPNSIYNKTHELSQQELYEQMANDPTHAQGMAREALRSIAGPLGLIDTKDKYGNKYGIKGFNTAQKGTLEATYRVMHPEDKKMSGYNGYDFAKYMQGHGSEVEQKMTGAYGRTLPTYTNDRTATSLSRTPIIFDPSTGKSSGGVLDGKTTTYARELQNNLTVGDYSNIGKKESGGKVDEMISILRELAQQGVDQEGEKQLEQQVTFSTLPINININDTTKLLSPDVDAAVHKITDELAKALQELDQRVTSMDGQAKPAKRQVQ